MLENYSTLKGPTLQFRPDNPTEKMESLMTVNTHVTLYVSQSGTIVSPTKTLYRERTNPTAPWTMEGILEMSRL